MWRLLRVVSLVGIVLLIVVLSGPLYAQEGNAALKRLEVAAEGPLEVTTSATTGWPSFIRGQMPAGRNTSDPADAAGAFLVAYGSALGVANPTTELAMVTVEVDELGMTRVIWQQVIDGVPVHNATINVYLAADKGSIVAATSGFRPDIFSPTTRPRITADQALASVLPAIPGGVVNNGPKLVIYPFNDGAANPQGRLAWIVDMGDSAIPARNLYVVDALSGQLFEVVNLLTGMAYEPAPERTAESDPDDGRTLHNGQPLSGDITPVGDIDTYVFVGQADQVVTLHMSENAFTSNLDPYISVYGPNGSLLATDNDSGSGDNASVRKFRLPEPGTYTVQAQSFSAQSGLYTVEMLQCEVGEYFAEYYDNRYLEDEPVMDQCEPAPINYPWGNGGPTAGTWKDNFSARWSGEFNFESDTYTFAAYVDDGIRVWLDGNMILDEWWDHAVQYYSADVAVTAGVHEVTVEYYEHGGGADINFRWYGWNSDNDDNRVLEPLTPLSGDITPASDGDVYFFDGEAGDLVNLSMVDNNFTPSLDPYLVVFSPDGQQLTSDDDSGEDDAAAIGRLELPQTGRYSVWAYDFSRLNSGLYTIEFWLTGLYRETYDAEHRETLPGKLVRVEGQGPVNDRDADQAHDFAGNVYAYYDSTHDRLSFDNLGSALISTVHYGQNFNNAFWDGRQMTYGDGTAVLDVVGHELTHGVVSTTANLKYEWQSGAMNESFADIFGAMIDRNDWLMGEDLSPDMLAGREALRDMSDPERFGHPAHADDWVSTCSDNQGVHTNSGIFNKAYYNVATNLDKFRAEQIFYRALTIYLHPSSSLEDGRAAAIQAAIDLYGTGVEEQQVVAGFNAVGLDGQWNPRGNDCSCAVTALTADEGLFSEALAGLRTVTTLYRVRDTLLAGTARGRHYRDLYADHTGGITRLLTSDGDLRRRGAALLSETQPALERLADGQGEDALITERLVADVRAFLRDLAAKAETNGNDILARTIRQEMKQIDWDQLVGMTYEEAWSYLNAPQSHFVPLIVSR